MGFTPIRGLRRKLLAVACWSGLLVSMLAFGQSSLAQETEQEVPPTVAVSIAPLYSWVSMVSGDLWDPVLLLPAENDPHNALLRPSQRRVLEDADWILWLGPQLETGLEALMRRVDSDRLWTLSEPGSAPQALTLHEFRTAGTVLTTPTDPHEHGAPDIDFPGDGSDQSRRGMNGSGMDPHLWLDPHNAQQALAYIADHLAGLDPAHAETYQANAVRAAEKLKEASTVWQQQLDDVEPLPYLVFHDGYQYFDRAFGLTFAGAVTLNPEQLPGLRTINRMREGINEGELGCLFAEVQYSDRLVQTIGSGFNLDIQRIDALGVGIEPGPNHYFQLMDQLVAAFSECG